MHVAWLRTRFLNKFGDAILYAKSLVSLQLGSENDCVVKLTSITYPRSIDQHWTRELAVTERRSPTDGHTEKDGCGP